MWFFYGLMSQGQNMSGDPRRSRENALHCAKRATTTRTPEVKMPLVQWAKGFLRRSIERQRHRALGTWMDRLGSRRVTSPHRSDPAGPEHLEKPIDTLPRANSSLPVGATWLIDCRQRVAT